MRQAVSELGRCDVLTIAKPSRWSINYYNDTARAAAASAVDALRAGGGLGEYYAEHDTRTPVWLCAGDTHTAAKLIGLTDVQRAGGPADPEVVQRWLDDGTAPNGASGRAFGNRGVHGFDLTFCAPKSVSLIRALRAGDVADKAIADAHATAISDLPKFWPYQRGRAEPSVGSCRRVDSDPLKVSEAITETPERRRLGFGVGSFPSWRSISALRNRLARRSGFELVNNLIVRFG